MLRRGTRTQMLPGSGVNLRVHSLMPYPENEGQCRDKFLFVGRIMKDKGVRELFKAASALKREYPGTSFELVGGADEDFSEELSALEQEGVIRYWGQQPSVRTFIKKCNAVVLPSYHEGMSNILLEAAASGRPVLTSRVPGCMETFDEGISGFGFAPKDSEDLYRTMKKFILLDHAEKRGMGMAARRKMEDLFDRDDVVDSYIEEIGKLEDQKRAAI